MLQYPEAILFDFGGTLFDDELDRKGLLRKAAADVATVLPAKRGGDPRVRCVCEATGRNPDFAGPHRVGSFASATGLTRGVDDAGVLGVCGDDARWAACASPVV